MMKSVDQESLSNSSGASEPAWKRLFVAFPQLPDCLLLLVVFEIVYATVKPDVQWQWMGLYGVFLLAMSSYSRTPLDFFKGGITDKATDNKSFGLLSGSAFISWIFAKSIQNSSKLGAKYGFMGGVAYSTWYTSFASSAIVIYLLRTRHGYTSLPEAINGRYGALACVSFMMAITYRLYQEIWSNSTVVASFYGPYGSIEWWMAAILSTIIPLAYVTLGGLRSSLNSDALQAVLAIILLATVLGAIGTKVNGWDDACKAAGRSSCNAANWDTNPGVDAMTLEGGLDMVLVGLLQGCFSYPFFDPVLTDRAFLAEPRTMLRAFISGGTGAAIFIMLFSIIGVYGNMAGTLFPSEYGPDVTNGTPADVARTLGTPVFSVANIIFLTTSISTLDSTFASTGKLAAEMQSFALTWVPRRLSDCTETQVALGRFAMRLIALFGTLPLLQQPDELTATTVSGTVVMGLGPPVIALIWLPRDKFYPMAFLSSFWLGVALGVVYQVSGEHSDQLDMSGDEYKVGKGSYAKLLWFNLVGSAAALGAFVLCFLVEHFYCNHHVAWYKDRKVLTGFDLPSEAHSESSLQEASLDAPLAAAFTSDTASDLKPNSRGVQGVAGSSVVAEAGYPAPLPQPAPDTRFLPLLAAAPAPTPMAFNPYDGSFMPMQPQQQQPQQQPQFFNMPHVQGVPMMGMAGLG